MKFFVKLIVSLALLTALQVHALPHKLVKRGVSWVQCPDPGNGKPIPQFLTVSASPDPPVAGQSITFTYSGPINHDISADDMVGALWLDPDTGFILKDQVSAPVCTGSECPIKAGTPFTKQLQDTAPSSLPDPYILVVAVGNPEQAVLYACAMTTVG